MKRLVLSLSLLLVLGTMKAANVGGGKSPCLYIMTNQQSCLISISVHQLHLFMCFKMEDAYVLPAILLVKLLKS